MKLPIAGLRALRIIETEYDKLRYVVVFEKPRIIKWNTPIALRPFDSAENIKTITDWVERSGIEVETKTLFHQFGDSNTLSFRKETDALLCLIEFA